MPLQKDRLKKMREISHLSQSDLADRINISLRQIGRYEHGDDPSADILAKMAKVLNCSADYLVGLSDDPSPKTSSMDEEYRVFFTRFHNLPQDVQDLIKRLVFKD